MGNLIEIDKYCTRNPNKFWSYINKFGPVKKEKIPWEVVVEGRIQTDKHIVLHVWKTAFERLYQDDDANFCANFKAEKVNR